MLERVRTVAALAGYLATASALAADPADARPLGRLVLAVPSFANRTGDPQAHHWRDTLDMLAEEDLTRVKALRLVGSEAIAWAWEQAKIDEGVSLDEATARRIGEIVEAQRVVWGSYARDGERWTVRARVMNVATGKTSPELTVAGADWFDIRDALVAAILKELGVSPTEPERARMARRATRSAEALESFSRGSAIFLDDGPPAEAEELLRKAVAADPEFAEAHIVLGALLASQGKDAEAVLREGIQLAPEDAKAHQVLGTYLAFRGRFDDAEKELWESEDLDPDYAVTDVRLGELYKSQGKLVEALAFFRKAVRLAPRASEVHAGLAHVYALKRDREHAIAEAQEAERLDPENSGLNPMQMLALTYDRLGETALAVRHYERFVELARKVGVNPSEVDRLEARGKQLKATLEPTFLDVPMPRTYTEPELDEALRQKLTPDELKRVVNPLADTPEMREWARELTRMAEDERGKARALFDPLARRLGGPVGGSARTAREVFAAWKDPAQSLNCQEYAKLFVALARSVGLRAFYVHLEKDYSGRPVFHDCAAVFVDGRALLVDPAYRWLGVPHREFMVLDDLQAIAHQLFQGFQADPVGGSRIAAKLHPGFVWGLSALAGSLIWAEDWDEARKAIAAAEELDPERWYVLRARGVLATHDGKAQEAAALLERALTGNPGDPAAHFALARVLEAKGDLKEAREHYRASLGPGSSPQQAQLAWRRIAAINEKIGSE